MINGICGEAIIMTVYKLVFHICAFFKLIFLKLVFGKKFKIGKQVTWRRRFNIMIDKNAHITIGKNCFFNNDCSLNALNSITIGEGSIFGENVKIYDHNHRFCSLDLPLKKQGYSIGEVYIGNNCWIGSNVVILKGTNIGDNCVIGAGEIISYNVDSGTIVKSKKNPVLEKVRG